MGYVVCLVVGVWVGVAMMCVLRMASWEDR